MQKPTQGNRLVSFRCVVRDKVGTILSSSFNRDVSVGEKTIDMDGPPGLIEGLQNLKAGERRSIVVKPERGYGYYDPELVMRVPRRRLPNGNTLEVGFQIFTRSASGEPRVFRVIEVSPRSVVLDGNHPLAGHELCFEIEAVSTRRLTRGGIRDTQGSPAAPPLRSRYGPYLQ